MKKYYFLYKRHGKRQIVSLWAIVEIEEGSLETPEQFGIRTLFFGDFSFEFVTIILIK